MNRTHGVILGLCLATLALWSLTPAKLEPPVAEFVPPENLASWLVDGERRVADRFGLVPGTEKRITWFDGSQRTPYSVLYLHGFSATRQETAPLAATVASELGANLFETRLTGHGRQSGFLEEVSAEDWLRDAAEALAIVAALGERIVIIGTSTGATLAAAMLGHPAMTAVDTIVMLSPNFAPRDPGAVWLTRPAGPLLAKLLLGETRSWQPHNEAQGRYWSTAYPVTAAVEMMRLVDLANRRLPASVPQRLLVFYSMDDQVVSPEAALSVIEKTIAPQKALVEITNPGDPSHHVLAGDVLSKQKTRVLADHIVRFILHPGP